MARCEFTYTFVRFFGFYVFFRRIFYWVDEMIITDRQRFERSIFCMVITKGSVMQAWIQIWTGPDQRSTSMSKDDNVHDNLID